MSKNHFKTLNHQTNIGATSLHGMIVFNCLVFRSPLMGLFFKFKILYSMPKSQIYSTVIQRTLVYEWTDNKTGKKKRQPLWFAQAKGFGGKHSSFKGC